MDCGLNTKIHCLALPLVKFSVLIETLNLLGSIVLSSIYIPCFQAFVSDFDFVYQMNHFEYIEEIMGNIAFFKPDRKQAAYVSNL